MIKPHFWIRPKTDTVSKMVVTFDLILKLTKTSKSSYFAPSLIKLCTILELKSDVKYLKYDSWKIHKIIFLKDRLCI